MTGGADERAAEVTTGCLPPASGRTPSSARSRSVARPRFVEFVELITCVELVASVTYARKGTRGSRVRRRVFGRRGHGRKGRRGPWPGRGRGRGRGRAPGAGQRRRRRTSAAPPGRRGHGSVECRVVPCSNTTDRWTGQVRKSRSVTIAATVITGNRSRSGPPICPWRTGVGRGSRSAEGNAVRVRACSALPTTFAERFRTTRAGV